MDSYPVQVPIFRWKSNTLCQIVCRPDALAPLCAELLNLEPTFGPIRIGSVETEGNSGKVKSFLLSIDVPPRLRESLGKLVDVYRTKE